MGGSAGSGAAAAGGNVGTISTSAGELTTCSNKWRVVVLVIMIHGDVEPVSVHGDIGSLDDATCCGKI